MDLLASVPEPRPVTTFIRIRCQRGKSQLSVMDYQLTFHLTIFSPGAELARKDLFKYVSSRIKALLNSEQVFSLQSFPDRIFFSSMHYLVSFFTNLELSSRIHRTLLDPGDLLLSKNCKTHIVVYFNSVLLENSLQNQEGIISQLWIFPLLQHGSKNSPWIY